MKKCPPISADLIAHLEWVFPDKLSRFDNRTPDREIHQAIGEARVVSYLRHVHTEQQKNILTT